MKKADSGARRQFYDNAITAVLSAWVYCAFTLVDGLFIARYVGESGLAGIALAVPLLCFPYALSAMVGVGASTMISYALSQGEFDKARAVFTQAIVLSIGGGIVLAGGIHLAAPFVIPTGGENSALAAIDYARWCGYFGPFMIVAYATEFFLRIEGAGRYGLCCLLAGAVLNIALDYLLIGVLGAGLPGAAIATGISHLVVALAMLWRYLRRPRALFLSWAGLRAGRLARRIAYLGAAECVTDLAPAVSVGMFNAVIYARLGNGGLSVYAVVEYVVLFATVTTTGMIQGMQPVVSFQHGRGTGGEKAVALLCALYVVGYTCVIAALMVGAPDRFARMFLLEKPEVLAMLHIALPCYAFALLPAAVTQIITGYMTAIAMPMMSLLITLCRHGVILLGMVWFLPRWLGDHGIWLAMLVTELIVLPSVLLFVWRYRRRAALSRGNC